MTYSQEALVLILDTIPYPVFVKDEGHRWVFFNPAFCDLMGRTPEELSLKTDRDFLPPAQADVFWAVDDRVLETGEQVENEEVITDASGSVRVINTLKRRIELTTPDGPKRFVLAVLTDVTKYREAEEQARHWDYDPLTGLPNRMHFKERLTEALVAARSSGAEVALVLIDLDNFKEVNRSYGHHAADEILQIEASRLKRVVRSGDLLARVGGDEFCIVQIAPNAATNHLAKRIKAALSRPLVGSWGTISISGSIGFSNFPRDGQTQEELLEHAEASLPRPQNSGVTTEITPASPPAAADRGALARDLVDAIKSSSITLAYQPIASAADSSIEAFEALARWQHPSLGAIPPDEFIPLAEELGVMPSLGRELLHKACQAAAQWPTGAEVCVNVSPVQFENGDVVSVVKGVLSETGLSPERLEVEVTESVTLGSSPAVLQAFRDLKKIGISIALDDFGSGWASLDVLRQFPFDRLKVDRSFVAHMESDPRSAAILRAVLSLGRALNLPVTAEGVETKSQFEALKNMGCDRVQGYYIGRPGQLGAAMQRSCA